MENKGDEILGTNGPVLSSDEIDAIGEVLNISMGSAATAISTLLDKQVIITTPRVSVEKFYDVDYAELEPAISVKIEYVEGISGCNVMVFRTSDMQIILNLLMGNEEPPEGEFVFDELSMSAACEVMNQMMGASATALSEFLGKTINISTPTACILDSVNTFQKAVGVNENDKIISVGFSLCIEGVMNSDFISVMSCELAKMIVEQVMGEEPHAMPAAIPAQNTQQQPAQAPPQKQIPPPPPQQPSPQQMPPPPQMGTQQQMPPSQQQMPPPQMGGAQQQMSPPQQQQYYPGMEQQPYGQQPYPYPPYMYQQPPYGYPPGYGAPPPPQGDPHIMRQADVKHAQFPSFAGSGMASLSPPLMGGNMDLVMNVPLNVSIEIGKTKRKIKDIMEFNQGTVIELEKQAGAPVDVVVNGQLIARGDVVVIGDNFGVRITEILGTQEIVNTLNNV